MRTLVLCYLMVLSLAVNEHHATSLSRNTADQQITQELDTEAPNSGCPEGPNALCGASRQTAQCPPCVQEAELRAREAFRAVLNDRMQQLEERWRAQVGELNSATKKNADAATRGQLLLNQLDQRVKNLEAIAQRLLEKSVSSPSSTPSSLLGNDLYTAAMEGKLERVRSLLDAGADVNFSDKKGITPLMAAIHHNGTRGRCDAAVVSLLLERGARVNAQAVERSTPLHYATYWGPNARCVALLLGAGAYANARRDNGVTPLHFAAWRSDEPSARALLAAGATKDLRAWDGAWRGKTPFDVSQSNAVRDLVRP